MDHYTYLIHPALTRAFKMIATRCVRNCASATVPAMRDITETVSLLARISRFIIADLTDPSSIPRSWKPSSLEPLLATLAERVIAPAEGKVKALAERRCLIEAELTKLQ